MPSVAINEGILNLRVTIPLTKPTTSAMPSANATASAIGQSSEKARAVAIGASV